MRVVYSSSLPFGECPVPVQAIRVLWQEFNLCADSWAITPVFWKQLCKVMAEAMEDDFNEAAAAAVFAVFDTDRVMMDYWVDIFFHVVLIHLRSRTLKERLHVLFL